MSEQAKVMIDAVWTNIVLPGPHRRIAKGLLLECKQTIEHSTTQVKSEEYNNEQK